MADQPGEVQSTTDTVVEKIMEKIYTHRSSSSDSDEDKTSYVKAKIYRLFGREKPVHKVFGGGKAADVFLWRDKKISAGILGVATIIWVLFELLEYHLLTLVCHILILALANLFMWSQASIYINKSPPRVPEMKIPKDAVLSMASALRFEINRALAILRDIASGRDLKIFLAVTIGLWFISIVGSFCNFLTLLYLFLLVMLTVPVLYEKYEEQIDAFAEKAEVEIKKQYKVLHENFLSKIPKGTLKEKKMA